MLLFIFKIFPLLPAMLMPPRLFRAFRTWLSPIWPITRVIYVYAIRRLPDTPLPYDVLVAPMICPRAHMICQLIFFRVFRCLICRCDTPRWYFVMRRGATRLMLRRLSTPYYTICRAMPAPCRCLPPWAVIARLPSMRFAIIFAFCASHVVLRPCPLLIYARDVAFMLRIFRALRKERRADARCLCALRSKRVCCKTPLFHAYLFTLCCFLLPLRAHATAFYAWRFADAADIATLVLCLPEMRYYTSVTFAASAMLSRTIMTFTRKSSVYATCHGYTITLPPTFRYTRAMFCPLSAHDFLYCLTLRRDAKPAWLCCHHDMLVADSTLIVHCYRYGYATIRLCSFFSPAAVYSCYYYALILCLFHIDALFVYGAHVTCYAILIFFDVAVTVIFCSLICWARHFDCRHYYPARAICRFSLICFFHYVYVFFAYFYFSTCLLSLFIAMPRRLFAWCIPRLMLTAPCYSAMRRAAPLSARGDRRFTSARLYYADVVMSLCVLFTFEESAFWRCFDAAQRLRASLFVLKEYTRAFYDAALRDKSERECVVWRFCCLYSAMLSRLPIWCCYVCRLMICASAPRRLWWAPAIFMPRFTHAPDDAFSLRLITQCLFCSAKIMPWALLLCACHVIYVDRECLMALLPYFCYAMRSLRRVLKERVYFVDAILSRVDAIRFFPFVTWYAAADAYAFACRAVPPRYVAIILCRSAPYALLILCSLHIVVAAAPPALYIILALCFDARLFDLPYADDARCAFHNGICLLSAFERAMPYVFMFTIDMSPAMICCPCCWYATI